MKVRLTIKSYCVCLMSLLATTWCIQAQTLTTLYALNDASGIQLEGPLTLSPNGTLYGATYEGGPSHAGTVFAINTNGTDFTVVDGFSGQIGTGGNPFSGVLLSGSMLYGETFGGGAGTSGTIFAIGTDGTGFTILHSFNSGNSPLPSGGLTLSGDTLYGVTRASFGGYPGGSIFAVKTNGANFTSLYTFNSAINTNGINLTTGLVLSGDRLYGVVQLAGASGGSLGYGGAVFAIGTNGSGFTTLFPFVNTNDGGLPNSLVVSNGMLYGTAGFGGKYNQGIVFALGTNGAGFTILHNFNGTNDGTFPGGLILYGNTLYGTTVSGGISNNGALFAINTNGSGFTTLYNFNETTGTGANVCNLSGNIFYGATEGGVNSPSIVFALSLSPPIATPMTVLQTVGTPLEISLTDVATNWNDPDGYPITLMGVNPVTTNGIAVVTNGSYIFYTNSLNLNDQITYAIEDNQGLTSTGAINVVINTNIFGPTGLTFNPAGGAPVIQFTGQSNHEYSVQVSTNLVDWSVIWMTNLPVSGGFQFEDDAAPQPTAFYRLQWNP